MEQLSSCYFCGDALDASLDEYPLVPDSLAPAGDDRQTIVLCPTCKRKLDPVVEVVANAVAGADLAADHPETDEDVVVADSDESGGHAGEDVPEDADDADDADTGSSSIIGETPPGANDDFDDGPADSDDADTGSSPQSDIGSTLGDDEDVLRPVGGDSRDGEERPPSADTGASSAGGGRTRSNDGPDTEDPGRSNEPRQRTYTSGQRAGGRPTGGDQSGGDDGETNDGDEADDQSGSDRDITLSRLENTNVMRLLQNREFPVDRDDFVIVASSAYEVQPRHCEKVIDLAVKHDLLREEEGELLAGSNWS